MINNARQQQLTKQLNRLEAQLDLSSDTKEQMRLEGEIKQCNEKLAVLKIPYLVQQAHELKRKGSYTEALGKWRIIQKIQPQHPELNYAIEILTLAKKNHQLKQTVMPQLALQVTVLSTVWRDLITDINAIKNSLNSIEAAQDYQLLLTTVDSFIRKELSADDFIIYYQAQQSGQVATKSNDSHQHEVLTGIARRIQEGDIVLFLGADIARHYQHDILSEKQIANQLAEQAGITDFKGSLSSIAEYYLAQPSLSTNKLHNYLQQQLPSHTESIQFYQHLAQTPAPQIIISTAYDGLLEHAFKQAGKPFVTLSSTINNDDIETGHIRVRYSDQHQATTLTGEKLSGLQLTQNGYSIIYKLRGTCDPSDDLMQDSLLLAEHSYFEFARKAEKSIPGYLVNELRKRGFLFLGYRLREWEDRLLMKALLAKRNKRDEPSYVFSTQDKLLEDAHWTNHQVKHHPWSLTELDQCLQAPSKPLITEGAV